MEESQRARAQFPIRGSAAAVSGSLTANTIRKNLRRRKGNLFCLRKRGRTFPIARPGELQPASSSLPLSLSKTNENSQFWRDTPEYKCTLCRFFTDVRRMSPRGGEVGRGMKNVWKVGETNENVEFKCRRLTDTPIVRWIGGKRYKTEFCLSYLCSEEKC